MQLSMWTYPWDILDVGFDETVAELRAAGLNAVSLATSYHAGRFFQARSPARKAYFPEDGTIYFRPDPGLWEGRSIRPEIASVVGRGDVLRDLVDRRDRTGLKVGAWTVCLHNTRLGMLHPDAVTRNAFEPVTSLVAEIRQHADPASRIHMIDLADGWKGGCDHAALGKACDGLILCAYGLPPSAVAALLAQGRAALGPGKHLGAGFRLFFPEVTGADDLTAKSAAVAEAGADAINYYNYGLIPAARMRWIRQAADRIGVSQES